MEGGCESGDGFNASADCNKKVIGAKWFIDAFLAEYGMPLNTSAPGSVEFLSPRDANGHGTHTASIAAGAFVANVSYKGLGRGAVREGAPQARLAVYKVCWNVFGGICSSADILAAYDAAIHDGIGVISMSIGNFFPAFPEVDARNGISVGSFHAVANGITVVASAGNYGPNAQTVVATAPWLLTVAASSMDRGFISSVIAFRNSPSDLQIFAEGSPRKLADPFDYGGGIVNPNDASDPSLVYDMGTSDYLHYLCAMGYNSSSISHLTIEPASCPRTKPSILNVNLPSITIPSLERSVTITRTVTNVGDAKSIFKALIDPPFGVIVTVKPDVLVFNDTSDKVSFSVTLATTQEENIGYNFGSLTWSDGKHHVRTPLSVRIERSPFFY